MKYLFILSLLCFTLLYAQENKYPSHEEIRTCLEYCALPADKKKLREGEAFKVCGDCSNTCFKDKDACLGEIKEDLEVHDKKGKKK
jgi:hypothetical protein